MLKKENLKLFNPSGCLTKTINSIRQFEVPTEEEELELFNKYKKTGDLKYRDEIVLRNQRFVLANAKIYAKNEDELSDYLNEGNIGMIEAIN